MKVGKHLFPFSRCSFCFVVVDPDRIAQAQWQLCLIPDFAGNISNIYKAKWVLYHLGGKFYQFKKGPFVSNLLTIFLYPQEVRTSLDGILYSAIPFTQYG